MYYKKSSSLIILIPARNELKNFKNFFLRLKKKYKILVIDDGSTDKTSQWLKANRIEHLVNKENIGYEKSLIKGIKFIINNKRANKILTMDADGQHKISNINKFLALEKKFKTDLLIGERKYKNRIIENVLSKFFFKKYLIKDPISGFKLYKTDKLKKINISKCSNLFLVDLLIKFINRRYKIKFFQTITKKRKDNPRVGNFIKVNIKILKILIYVFLQKN
jgi:glycosyltransferase involved in cell wall biosynthesis|tara:strand:- start:108 stop:770 length:663 start_codon:yes stop_codon:yes gene_type:complete